MNRNSARRAGKVVVYLGMIVWSAAMPGTGRPVMENDGMREIPLPQIRIRGGVLVEEAMRKRRSVRDYGPGAVSLEDVSQLLWAAQGISGPGDGFRTAPSAGATYPLELLVAAERVAGLEPGVYRYVPERHALRRIAAGGIGEPLSRAALGQPCVLKAAANFVLAAEYARTTRRYRERGRRYVHMEAGHAAQNLLLQAVSLRLGSVPVGAFEDEAVRKLLRLPKDEEPLYIIPVGRSLRGNHKSP